jgi:hypothetical protein
MLTFMPHGLLLLLLKRVDRHNRCYNRHNNDRNNQGRARRAPVSEL